MTAPIILWGQVLAVVFIILASVWPATQWTAGALGFQPELGTPWFGLFAYERGGHGFNLGVPGTTTTGMLDQFVSWMDMQGLTQPEPSK